MKITTRIRSGCLYLYYHSIYFQIILKIFLIFGLHFSILTDSGVILSNAELLECSFEILICIIFFGILSFNFLYCISWCTRGCIESESGNGMPD